MLFRGMQSGPEREYFFSHDGRRVWIPRGRGGLDRPSWNDVLKLAALRVLGVEVWDERPVMAGGGFFGGGGSAASTGGFALTAGNVGDALAGPTDATIYYVTDGLIQVSSGAAARFTKVVPVNATLTAHSWAVYTNTTAASSENVTHTVRQNDSSDATAATFNWDNGVEVKNGGSASGLSVAYAANDTVLFKILTPTWTTNPDNIRASAAAFFTVP